MKYIYGIIAILVVFFAANGAVFAAVIDLDGTEPLSVRVTESDDTGVTYLVEIGSLRLTPIKNNRGEMFIRIMLPGSGIDPKIGEPEIPVVTRFVEIPAAGNATLNVTTLNEKIVSLNDYGAYTVWPVQEPVVKLPGAIEAATFRMHSDVYSTRGFRGPTTSLGPVGVMRGMRFVPVTVAPIRYDASANALKIATRMLVRVRFDTSASRVGTITDPVYRTPAFEAMADGLFLNHRTMRLTKADTPSVPEVPTPAGYLIIAAPAFEDNADLLDLAAWKAEKGFDVHLVTTNETGTTADDVKAYINDAYTTWEIPPAYILLVGDTDTMPYFVGTQSDNPDTDLYFATQDGEDYFPDLFYSRLPVRTDTDLGNIVKKILSYEWGQWSDADAFERATFLASTDNSDISEGTHNYCIDTWLDPAGFTNYKRYSAQGATIGEVIADINADLNYVVYSGHGSTDSWADGPAMSQSDVQGLSNKAYPYVGSHACLTGQFTQDECFGETWIRTENGAMAFYGSSVTSYWDEDDILQRRYFDGLFDTTLSPRHTTIGEFTTYGMAKLWEYYTGGGSVQRYYEMYNIFGDASVDVWTAQPTEMDVGHLPVIYLGSTTFTVSVAGEEGALVGLSADGEFIASALTDGSGIANLYLDDPIATPGYYQLAVTKHDRLPYRTDILGTSASSDGLLIANPDTVGDGMTITIMVADNDLTGAGTVDVQVSSDGETTPETLTLSEVVPDTGVLSGTIVTRASGSPASDDGFINVQADDTVSVLYHDADTGSGAEDKTASVAVDITPPTFAGLTSVEPSDKTLTLSWSAANEPNGPVTYQIYRSDSAGGQDFDTPLDQTTNLTYTESGLTNGQSYYYVVRATDRFENQDGNTTEVSGAPVGPERIFYEDFETRSAADWSIEDGLSDGLTWSTEDECASGASSVTTGRYMLADSDCPGYGTHMEEGLVSPVIDCSQYRGVFLRFGNYSVNWWTTQSCMVQISINQGEWTSLLEFEDEKEEKTEIDLAAYADHASDVRLRFYYSGDYAYWWAVDEIEVLGYPESTDDDDTTTDDTAADDTSGDDDTDDDIVDDDTTPDDDIDLDDDAATADRHADEDSGGGCCG